MNEYQKYEYLRKKELLRKFKYSDEDIQRKENKIKELKDRIENTTGVKCVSISDMPRGGIPKEFTDYVNEYLDEIVILTNNIKRKKALTERIENAIDNLEDYELRRILKFIYYDKLTIPETARKMFVSERTIKRNHKQAIIQLSIKL